MVFARFRPSLTSAATSVSRPSSPHAQTNSRGILYTEDWYREFIMVIRCPRLDLKYFSEWTEIWYKKRDECQMFFFPVPFTSCRVTQTWRCAARGDDHLSWHCRDDCLDVHESICRAYQISFAISLLVL